MSPSVTILEAGSGEAQSRWAELRRITRCNTCFDSLPLVVGLTAAQSLDSRAIFISRAGNDVAAFLATFRRIGPFTEVVPPKLVPFSPILLRRDASERKDAPVAVAALRNHLVDRYHRIVVTLPPECHALADLVGSGWKSDHLRTYMVQLQETPEDITRTWSAGTRRLYRKHEHSFAITEDESATGRIVSLWHEAYDRSDRPISFDLQRLVEVITSVQERGECRVFAATRIGTGTIEGGLVVLLEGEKAYYWLAGSVPGPAMTVILGFVLARLRSEGIETFDFVGANTPSIAEFKRRFGPTLVEYPRLVASRSRIFDAMLAAKHTLSEKAASL